MFRIIIEDKREFILYAIALGCLLLLAAGVALIYWTQYNGQDIGGAGDGEPVTAFEMSEKMQRVSARGNGRETPGKAISSTSSFSEKDTDNTALWFFGTLMSALLVLFVLTFRYYSHREVKEAERRWQRATGNCIARMEVERVNFEDEQFHPDTIWSRVLKGEGIET